MKEKEAALLKPFEGVKCAQHLSLENNGANDFTQKKKCPAFVATY